MMQNYEYLTCCVHSTAESIVNMVEQAVKITFEEFASFVEPSSFKRFLDNLGYDTHLKIENDWGVRFYRSVFDNQKCVYIDHSAIEYVFVEVNS